MNYTKILKGDFDNKHKLCSLKNISDGSRYRILFNDYDEYFLFDNDYDKDYHTRL